MTQKHYLLVCIDGISQDNYNFVAWSKLKAIADNKTRYMFVKH